MRRPSTRAAVRPIGAPARGERFVLVVGAVVSLVLAVVLVLWQQVDAGACEDPGAPATVCVDIRPVEQA